MQEDAQVWSDLLWLTGGLLELDKCSYHSIWYEFLQDGTPVMQSTRPGPPLIVNQLDNKTNTEIQYKNLYIPYAMLGHQKALGGGNLNQKISLQRKLERFAIKASTNSLTHKEVKMYYNSCYIKSVGYVLGQYFFTQDKLEEIEKDAIWVFTSQMRYNKNMAKVIRDSPESTEGVSVTRLIDVQGSEQVKKFLRRIRLNSQAQKLLVIACNWAHYQCRWNKSILEDVSSCIPQFEAR
eukprot:4223304-Ditylum_brightwellii.AAC.1